jgi:hypothetical protein
MAKDLVFMRVNPVLASTKTERVVAGVAPVMANPVILSASATRSTIHVVDRRTTVAIPVELANPTLASDVVKFRHRFDHRLGEGNLGDVRGQVKVPISPVAEPIDTVLFEDAADPAKKFYLPRYRVRLSGGRYEIGVASIDDGGWRLSAGLERFPAPELGAGAQGASPLPHEIGIFFRYGAGAAHAVEKRVDFNERIDDGKGVTVSVRLTLEERDNLLRALQTDEAAPKLVVRRAIQVAVKVVDQAAPEPFVLVRSRAKPLAKRAAASTLPLTAMRDVRFATVMQLGKPAASDRPPPPVDRYRTVQRALDDLADPELFVLDPLLHPYFYRDLSVGQGSAAAFRRIQVAHPPEADGATVHAYLQDQSEPWVFYYLPDSFRLSRDGLAPFLPEMMMQIISSDGLLENAFVKIEYRVKSSTDAGRLTAAAAVLKKEIGAPHHTEPELRPLQAAATLKMWLPVAGRAELRDMNDVAIDLANGFLHSLTLPLDDFRQIYSAALSQGVNSLFSGTVLVDTGLQTPEMIPLEIRFAHTAGQILSFVEQPSAVDGTIAVRLENSIESPVRLLSLPVRVRRGNQEAEATIEGLTFDPPIEVASGAKLSFTVRPHTALPGDGLIDAIFDTTDVEILPDGEKILPLITDGSVPAQYERQVEVITLPELLGDVADPTSIILIIVELKGGGSLKLTRAAAEGSAAVQLPLMDLLLGRDTLGKYRFRQQVIRLNKQRTDTDWREADFSRLVVPVV